MYSNDGHTVLVSSELMKSIGGEELLTSSIFGYEKKCNFDKHYRFSIRNEMKCPNCNYSLTKRASQNYTEIINSRLVFLDGMTFINDEKIYKVTIKTN